uniref:ferritin-like domain-containing protein n=1 Tax=Ideonella sp. B508-1 TaxID=137716 RepID=UPI0003B4D43C
MELRTQALKVLCETDPTRKAEQARALYFAPPTLDTELNLSAPLGLPGRPERPLLVPADQVPARSPFTPQGRAALLHAICHIEFNAINLALDALWRFPGMPEAFYRDWLQVAGEEALHFTLLREHLRSLGHEYGDFDAHDGLCRC